MFICNRSSYPLPIKLSTDSPDKTINYRAQFNGQMFTANLPPETKTSGPTQRDWGANSWWQNTRLSYWPMAPAGDFDTFSKIFEFYLQTLDFNSARTEVRRRRRRRRRRRSVLLFRFFFSVVQNKHVIYQDRLRTHAMKVEEINGCLLFAQAYFGHPGIFYTETKTLFGAFAVREKKSRCLFIHLRHLLMETDHGLPRHARDKPNLPRQARDKAKEAHQKRLVFKSLF